MNTSFFLRNERWWQDTHDPDLWHGAHGVMVNGAALTEREPYYRIVRLVQERRAHPPVQSRVA